jgi:plasmid rolling circle replication initiator protein Rep
MQGYYNTAFDDCQAVSAVLDQIKIHKAYHTQLLPELLEAFKATSHYTAPKAERMASCGDFVVVAPNGKITGANFCKNRYCPVCQWRFSRRMFGHASEIAKYAEEYYPDYKYIFLTLTIKNASKLSEGLETLLKGFNALTHDRTFRRVQRGFLRTVEITYNEVSRDWHPHIHSILAVDSSYFKGDYLSTTDWRKLWDRAAKLNYESVVDVRAVSEDRTSAIAEVAKYAVKPSSLNISGNSSAVYSELLEATFGRRLRSFGGIFREAVKALRINEDDPLDAAAEYEQFLPDSLFMVFEQGAYKVLDYDGFRRFGNGKEVQGCDASGARLYHAAPEQRAV